MRASEDSRSCCAMPRNSGSEDICHTYTRQVSLNRRHISWAWVVGFRVVVVWVRYKSDINSLEKFNYMYLSTPIHHRSSQAVQRPSDFIIPFAVSEYMKSWFGVSPSEAKFSFPHIPAFHLQELASTALQALYWPCCESVWRYYYE